MRKSPSLLAFGLAIIAIALTALLIWGEEPTIAGLAPDDFARLAQLSAILLLVGSSLVYFRTSARGHMRSALIWTAIAAVLVIGYLAFREEPAVDSLVPASYNASPGTDI